MIVLNNRTLFVVISIIPIIAFGKSPETFIDNDALNKPCYINSIKQKDLIVCFSKSYLLAQKRLNNNYLIAKKQKNINIKNYLIQQQIKWNKNKFDQCVLLPEREAGREEVFEYLQCVTHAVLEQNAYLEETYICDNNPCQFEELYFVKTVGTDVD